MQKILLVDDDDSTNFFHKRELKKAGVSDSIDCVENGEEAIEYIRNLIEQDLPFPDVIFLDINMPRMNGWEFLEEYEQLLQSHNISSNIVVMLTTSLNPDDREKADNFKSIRQFEVKPLSRETLPDIIAKF